MKTAMIVLAAAALLAPIGYASADPVTCLPDNPALESACIYNLGDGPPCPNDEEDSEHYTTLRVDDEDLLVRIAAWDECGYEEGETWNDHGVNFRVLYGEPFDPVVGTGFDWWEFDDTYDGEAWHGSGMEIGVFTLAGWVEIYWESENDECWTEIATHEGSDEIDCPAAPPAPPHGPWGTDLLP